MHSVLRREHRHPLSAELKPTEERLLVVVFRSYLRTKLEIREVTAAAGSLEGFSAHAVVVLWRGWVRPVA